MAVARSNVIGLPVLARSGPTIAGAGRACLAAAALCLLAALPPEAGAQQVQSIAAVVNDEVVSA